MTIEVKAPSPYELIHGTCNIACWEAREDVCHCMCGGRNHGIMRHGYDRPGRYCQRKGAAFKLEGIYTEWLEARNKTFELMKQYNESHNLPCYIESSFQQNATGHMLKWDEVKNFTGGNELNEMLCPPILVWVRTDEFKNQ